MECKDLIKQSLNMSLYVMNKYLEDMSDEELMKRPAENANHAAWQLGHLLVGEYSFLSDMVPGSVSDLPEGFIAKHTKDTCGEDDPAKFCTKAEYLELMNKIRAETIAALEGLDEAKFDEPGPEMIRAIAPTKGDTFLMCASHFLMHSGQIAVLRRKLGKEIVI